VSDARRSRDQAGRKNWLFSAVGAFLPKLDADVERARARLSGLEAAAWKIEANFGGLEP
jgi:hypothetical protein